MFSEACSHLPCPEGTKCVTSPKNESNYTCECLYGSIGDRCKGMSSNILIWYPALYFSVCMKIFRECLIEKNQNKTTNIPIVCKLAGKHPYMKEPEVPGWI